MLIGSCSQAPYGEVAMRIERTQTLMALLVVASAALVASGPAQTANESAAAQDCSGAEYRRLDFKLGQFDVTGMEGAKAGVSRVESLLDGCLLIEHWQGAISGYGKAFFYYDRNSRRWHTTYVTDNGESLVMSGVFEGDALVFRGVGALSPFPGMHRMAWSPLPNGVKQFWEVSADGGSTWKTIHIGYYARRP